MADAIMTTTEIREFDFHEEERERFDISQLYHSITEENPPTEFVGGIFPRKHVSIIASKAGVGKTWYILKFITDLSRGGTIFLSQAYYEKPGRSLVFCGETGIQLLTERQRRMHDKADSKNIAIVSRLEAARHGLHLNINTASGISAISALSKKFKPDCIIFDTLMSFRDDDENGAQDTSLMMARLQALADNLNAAVIVTHHLRKSAMQQTNGEGFRQRIDQDEIIGSSALVRQCGVAYILVKYGEKTFCLKPVKTWWENSKDVLYRMYSELGEIRFDIPLDENATIIRLKVEEFIKAQTEGQVFTAMELCEKFKISKPSCYRVFDRLCERAFPEQTKSNYYRLKGTGGLEKTKGAASVDEN